MSASPLPAVPASRDYDVLFINHANMSPEVPRGSVAFIDPPGYTGAGVYSVPYHDGRHHGDLRRIFWWSEGYRLKMDNWPEHAPLMS